MTRDGGAMWRGIGLEEELNASGASGCQTLLRGLDVIDALAEGPMTFAELAARLGLTRSTLHRLTAALVSRGLLIRPAVNTYGLGARLLVLAQAADVQAELATLCQPWLERLSQETRDSVHLGVAEGGRVLYRAICPGRRPINVAGAIGDTRPIASTALGKALVLDGSEAAWREIHAQGDPAYVGAAADWVARMKRYRRLGYALDLEENPDRIRCVAAPIRGVSGRIEAALSLSAAAVYMPDQRLAEMGLRLRDVAAALSRERGWRPQNAPQA